MRHDVLLAALLLAGAPLPAQTAYVSPLGAEFFEGNSSSGISFGFNGVNTQSRIQNIDLNLVGRNFPLIRSIAWRRDGNPPATATARTADVAIVMSHGDFNAMTSVFANNYKDNPVTVFRRKTVNLPDWTAKPAAPPGEFDLILPFDLPFLYNRVDGLLWEIVVQNLSNSAVYNKDFLRSIPHAYGDYPTELAPGCGTANGAMALSCGVRVNGASLELATRVAGAPGGAAVVLFLGTADPNVAVPGLCTSWRTNALAAVLLGTSDASGRIPLAVPLSAPWSPAFAGLAFFNQALALDPGQPGLPVALSNGLKCPVPASATVTPVNIKRSYSTSNATAATGSAPEISSVIARFSF